MNIENKGAFTITPTPALKQEETINYKAEIANVCRIPVGEIKPEELLRIYVLLTLDKGNLHNVASSAIINKYFGNIILDTPRLVNERCVQLTQLIESLTEIPSVVITYGSYANNYLQALNQYKEENVDNSTKHRSLLVGALSKATVNEYAATVRSVFPDAECLIVDLEGVDTVKAARDINVGFAYADGFKLPFDKAVFDVVHTSNLTGCSRGANENNRNVGNSEDRRALFSEFARVLKPAGMYVSSELSNDSYLNFSRRLKSEMIASGFIDVIFNPTKHIKNRREVDRFFRGIKSTIGTDNAMSIEASTLSFIARKPNCEKSVITL
jgi:SAM-dependent methyltransferase